MDRKESRVPQFGLCLNNDGYTASLDIGKLYRVIPDGKLLAQGYLRIVDESWEEYVYAANRFHLIDLPNTVEEVLLAASQR